MRTNGTVVGWGSDLFGQRTPPAGLTGVRAIAAGDGFSLALTGGRVIGWGDDSADQLDIPAGVSTAIAIAAGGYHGLALVVGTAPTLTSDSPAPRVPVGVAYSYRFTTLGAPPATFAVSSGSLPPGFTLDSQTGVLSGTPTDVGSFSFTVTASNGFLPDAVGQAHTIVVTGPLAKLALTPATAQIVVGSEQVYAVTGTDAAGNDLGDLTSSATFTINQTTGGGSTASCRVPTCTATAPGTYIVTATDATGRFSATASLTVVSDQVPVVPAPPAPPAPPATSPADSTQLADTGWNSTAGLVVGGLLITIGVLTLWTTKRRKKMSIG